MSEANRIRSTMESVTHLEHEHCMNAEVNPSDTKWHLLRER